MNSIGKLSSILVVDLLFEVIFNLMHYARYSNSIYIHEV